MAGSRWFWVLLGTMAIYACGRSNGPGGLCSGVPCAADPGASGESGAPSQTQGGEVGQPGTSGGGAGGIAGGEGGTESGIGGEEPIVAGAAGAGGEGGSCVPGSRVCDGSIVRGCDEQGQPVVREICTASQECLEAACHDIACIPNRTYCDGQQIRLCDETGTQSTPLESCEAGKFCLDAPGGASCSETVCAPGAGVCLGTVATHCRPDGSAPLPGGQDCAATEQVCQNGACIAATCTPGEKLCKKGDVYLCYGAGGDSVLFSDCAADEVCDPALLACVKHVCEPGKLDCDSTRVTTCNALGTGWVQNGPDCAATKQICSAGSCLDPVCTPNSTYCQAGSVYQCNAAGTAGTAYNNCTAYYYHCVQSSPTSASCVSNTCTPNGLSCVGNTVSTCNSDGSGYLDGGQSCGADVCYGGQCLPKVCTYSYPGYVCKDGDIYTCENNETFSRLVQDCGNSARCVKGASTSCVPYDCFPGTSACLKNQVGICADDGTSLSSVANDCAGGGQVCTTGGKCADTALDELGNAEDVVSAVADNFVGDVVVVNSNRMLTQIEADLVMPGDRSLRWLVLELTDTTFSPVYEVKTAQTATNGWVASGPLSYLLKAGGTYLIGVIPSGGGAAILDDVKPWSPSLSFGRIQSSLMGNNYYTYYQQNDRIYHLRLTTALP